MNYLLDTHIAFWMIYYPERLSPRAKAALLDDDSRLSFSVVVLWETVIKTALGRADFANDARAMRRALLNEDCVELVVTAEHSFAVASLPALHRDPFDRMMIAQARHEGLTLLTADRTVGRYGAGVLCV